MATQLATLFVRRLEVPVVLSDVDPARVETAIAGVRAELAKQVAKGRLPEAKAQFLGGIVTGGAGLDRYAGCDLVLEAVFEELEVKRQVLGGLEEVVDPGCLLLTNTSALSVAAMADRLRHPERVAGMHFFNPVAVLPLVELVRTPATDDVNATDSLGGQRPARQARRPRRRCAGVRRQPPVHPDVLGAAAGRRARLVDRTTPTRRRSGSACRCRRRCSSRWSARGSRTTSSQTLHAAYPDRFPLSPTLANFADDEDDIVRTSDAPSTVDEIHTAVLAALADETRHLLDEGVVGAAADVDTCMHPRRGLAVLPRRHHAPPRRRGRLRARRRREARDVRRRCLTRTTCRRARRAVCCAKRRPGPLKTRVR